MDHRFVLFKRHFPKSRGQVLIFALIALVVLLIIGLFLFDLHTILKGKVKGQGAVDSAALTGAMWQMNALDLIGELNLIKATTILTDESIFGVKTGSSVNHYVVTQMLPPEAYYSVGQDGEKEFDRDSFVADLNQVIDDYNRLDDAVQLLTQMQTRVGFVLPLLGYGAAQQAAKNNGLCINEDVQTELEEMFNDINDASLYGNPNLASPNLYGYAWRQPYGNMVKALYEDGAAVGTAVERLGAPKIDSMRYFLLDKDFYAAVLAKNWCHLREPLKESYSGAWWGTFESFTDDSFSGQAELLPLHLEHTTGSSGVSYIPSVFPNRVETSSDDEVSLFSSFYDSEEPYSGVLVKNDATGMWEINFSKIEDYSNAGQPIHNTSDTDYRFNVMPEFVWVTFGTEWFSYPDDFKDEWDDYMRSDFKEGYDYQSGALSYFVMSQKTNTLTGNLSGENSTGNGSVGDAFDFSEGSGDIKSAEDALRNDVHKIEADAVAKPFGRIKLESGTYKSPLYAARLVLPVFTETALMPVALETIYGDAQTDRNWLLFLTEYLPILGTSSSLEDAWAQVVDRYPDHAHLFRRYHYALTRFDDPEFRKEGMEWLEKYSSRCNEWPSGGSGPRRGPGKVH